MSWPAGKVGASSAPGVSLEDEGGSRPVSLVALVVLCGTSASILFHYVMGVYLHYAYPYSTFLFVPKDRFMDFFNVYRHAAEFRPGVSDNMVYSPLLHLFMTILNVMPSWLAFAAVVAVFLATLVAVLWSWTTSPLAGQPVLRALHVVILTVLSYPVLFVLDRGNLEMVVFVLLAAFFVLYYRRRSQWAWLPLALAIAAKYYWVTLLVLLLLDRQWRQVMWAVIAAALTSLGAALVLALTSGYSVPRVLGGLATTLDGHVGATGALQVAGHSHSLWAWVICVTRWTDYAFYWLPATRIYLLVALAVFVVVVRLLMRERFSDWRKATAVVACTLALPLESMDYTLIHLVLPLSLFAVACRSLARAWPAAALFGLLLVPLDYYYFTFLYWRSTVSISSLIYPVLLLALIGVALRGRDAEHEATAAGGPAAPAPEVPA